MFWSIKFMNTSLRLNHYWITCADGLETLLQEEIEQLGTKVTERSRTFNH